MHRSVFNLFLSDGPFGRKQEASTCKFLDRFSKTSWTLFD